MTQPSTGAGTTILIVEDDATLARGLAHNLEFEGYAVVAAGDAETAVDLLRDRCVDLILLDVMLPRSSGLDLCRTLRAQDVQTPIVMLTARGEEADRVLGLELGADDYVTKPFSVPELLARIKAVLRRARPSRDEAQACSFGIAVVDFMRFDAQVNGEPVHLSPKQFGLLQYLVRHEGRPVTRGELLDEVWGYDNPPTTRTVDNHVADMRAKLEEDPSAPAHILTVHGVGYKFVH